MNLDAANRRSKIGLALVLVGLVLLVVPSLAPVQPVLYHDGHASTMANGTMLEQQGYTIIEYEELSPRGQELYVEMLEGNGRFTVPAGQGASEFPYPTDTKLAEYEDWESRERAQAIVIERPDNADLPPAAERVEAAEYRARDHSEAEGGEQTTPSEAEIEQLRTEIARYDMIHTRTGEPPLGGTQHLLRMASLLAGVVAIGTGGYLLSTHG